MLRKYLFISDPSHAWLVVDRSELKSFGVENDRSSCAYVHRDKAYLEEDCDAGIFIDALKNAGHEVEFVEKHEEHTQIRNYCQFLSLV